MDAIRQLIKRVKATGNRRTDCVKIIAMGKKRVFEAFDVGEDTFIFERGISAHLQDRPSALIVGSSNSALGFSLSTTLNSLIIQLSCYWAVAI